MTASAELRPFSEEYLHTFVAWHNTEEHLRFHPGPPASREETAERLRAGEFDCTVQGGLFIVVATGEKPVGWVRYRRPDKAFDAFEIGITIAMVADRRAGLGSRALALLIDYLYATHDTARIQARVAEDNPASLRTLRRLGFREEGVARSAFRLDDRLLDVHLFGLLRGEWRHGVRRT